MKVPVVWEMCGFIDIPEESMKAAMERFNKESEAIPLPSHGEYVDGSFQLASTDPDEMRAMAQLDDR